MRLVLLSAALFVRAAASGVGPVGVSPVDGRYVLVAEKLDNAVLLVDLDRSRAVARRDLDGAPRYVAADPTTWPDAVGVATCAACPYG